MSTTVIIILAIYIIGVIGMLVYIFPEFIKNSKLEDYLILFTVTFLWPIVLTVGLTIIFIKTFSK